MNLLTYRRSRKDAWKYPGTPILFFKFLFKKVNEAAAILKYPSLPSPYSLVPLISQALGLGMPMMGSGKSPYSMISYFTRLNENIFLKNNSGLAYHQRRVMVDEIYDMIAPYLLNEQEEYIELLICARHKEALKNFSTDEITEFRGILKDKFKILHNLFLKTKFKGGHFAHIAHYGYPEDLYREESFLREFDAQALKLWRDKSYPIVTEIYIDNIDAPNKAIWGWYIFMPHYTKEIFKSSKLRENKLLQAGKLARSLGAKFAGMAGLVASFSKGGNFLAENIKGIGFTTGHAFTIANIYDITKSIIKGVSLDISKSKVAIVGAAGSIGSGVSKLIAVNNVKEILLVDMALASSRDKLVKLEYVLKKINKNIAIKLSTTVDDVVNYDILIVATNAITSIIRSRHLKKGAIIIDDSFPKNVSRSIIRERDDIILLEGGVAQFLHKHNVYVARNMPDLLELSISKLVSCKQAYGCLCETFILAAYGHKGNYGLGDADPKLAKDIWQKGQIVGVTSATFQNYGFAIEKSRIQKVKDIISCRS